MIKIWWIEKYKLLIGKNLKLVNRKTFSFPIPNCNSPCHKSLTIYIPIYASWMYFTITDYVLRKYLICIRCNINSVFLSDIRDRLNNLLVIWSVFGWPDDDGGYSRVGNRIFYKDSDLLTQNPCGTVFLIMLIVSIVTHYC